MNAREIWQLCFQNFETQHTKKGEEEKKRFKLRFFFGQTISITHNTHNYGNRRRLQFLF